MAFTQVNATRIAKRVVNRSFRLRDRYHQALGKLDPSEQWIVVQEVSKQIEQFTEKVLFACKSTVFYRTPAPIIVYYFPYITCLLYLLFLIKHVQTSG